MKTTLTLMLLALTLSLFGQNSKAKTDVRINTITKSVNYFYGNTTIATVILDQTPNPHLILKPVVITQDTSGYTMTFTFINPKHQTINDLDLEVTFDKPVISAGFNAGIEYYSQWGLNASKTQFTKKVQKIESRTELQLIIKSKEMVKVSIKGLDFAFDQ